MAEIRLSYAITTAVIIAFDAICFAARTKRLSGQKETRSNAGIAEIK